MTANTIHTCSYYCERPGCVRRQRDELRDRLEAVLGQQPAAPSAPVGANVRKAGEVSPYSDVVLVADLAQQPAAPQQPAGRVHDLAARLVDELDGLVGESDGVSGLHLNGDVATWDELLPGGRFERLSSLDELRAALAAQQQGGRDHG